ncbi:hypothetical protein BX600DRAFT_492281 [Xylariales sp. PMI_506]|nr:hypothetical protein BX600DRAFT_492281 [Xylariales sp. PMI_506]
MSYPEDEDKNGEIEIQQYESDSIPSLVGLERTIRSTLGWWKEEYIYCAFCLSAAAGLLALLIEYDGKLEPRLGAGLEFSTVMIAIMTIFRVALKAIVEASLSQGAWIWVSAARQRRKSKTEPARLGDFKMFDEASRGLWGSICLVWRLRGAHLACVGAGIIILIHGFETFSQEMVTFQELPMLNQSTAPPPPRSELWQNVVPKGYTGELDLGLSTKSAAYNGILANNIPELTVSWTSVTAPTGDSTGYLFTVAPRNISVKDSINASLAYFSAFDIMSLSKGVSVIEVEAYSCALWVCVKSYNTSVTEGQQHTVILGNWSQIEFAPATSAHKDEYNFINLPDDMNAYDGARFSVPTDAITVLADFMKSLTWGNASDVDGIPDYSSDWIQAMQNASLDLTAWMDRLSRSMSNDFRSSGGFNPSNKLGQFQYTGAVYIQASYVHVNWLWMIYPLSVMLIAFLYLAQTVWRTGRDRVCAWKSDSLPMLFAHIDRGIQRVVEDGMDVPEGLNDRVGRTPVELVRRGNGKWLFRLANYGLRRRRWVTQEERREERRRHLTIPKNADF